MDPPGLVKYPPQAKITVAMTEDHLFLEIKFPGGTRTLTGGLKKINLLPLVISVEDWDITLLTKIVQSLTTLDP